MFLMYAWLDLGFLGPFEQAFCQTGLFVVVIDGCDDMLYLRFVVVFIQVYMLITCWPDD